MSNTQWVELHTAIARSLCGRSPARLQSSKTSHHLWSSSWIFKLQVITYTLFLFVGCVWAISILLATDRPDSYDRMNQQLSVANKRKAINEKSISKHSDSNCYDCSTCIFIQDNVTSSARNQPRLLLHNEDIKAITALPLSVQKI